MLNAAPERRILIVAEALGYGGTESHLVTVLPRLAEAGLSIAVFCLADRGPRAVELEQAGVRVLAASRLANRREKPLLYPLQAGLDCSALYAFARQWRPQVAHFFLPGPYLLGTPVAVAAQIPIKVMSRRSLAHYQRNWRGARPRRAPAAFAHDGHRRQLQCHSARVDGRGRSRGEASPDL